MKRGAYLPLDLMMSVSVNLGFGRGDFSILLGEKYPNATVLGEH